MLKIVDGSGNVVGSYTYDAWGKVLSATGEIAQANPIRYRSYYYDAETGLYYLQSRYYDPEIGRFISADDTQYLGASGTALGYNLFGYCENNPVNAADPTGNVSFTVLMDIFLLVGGFSPWGLWFKIIMLGVFLARLTVAVVSFIRYRCTTGIKYQERNGHIKK